LRGKVTSSESIAATVSSAEALLAKLRKRLDGPVSWEIKRQLVEILVANIRVDTTESWGVKQAGITVNYADSMGIQCFGCAESKLVLASGGASRKELDQVIRTAMKAWPTTAQDRTDRKFGRGGRPR
jgi:hypothetical protein